MNVSGSTCSLAEQMVKRSSNKAFATPRFRRSDQNCSPTRASCNFANALPLEEILFKSKRQTDMTITVKMEDIIEGMESQSGESTA